MPGDKISFKDPEDVFVVYYNNLFNELSDFKFLKDFPILLRKKLEKQLKMIVPNLKLLGILELTADSRPQNIDDSFVKKIGGS